MASVATTVATPNSNLYPGFGGDWEGASWLPEKPVTGQVITPAGWIRWVVGPSGFQSVELLGKEPEAGVGLLETIPQDALSQAFHAKLTAYFEGRPVDFSSLPVDLSIGTDFQQAVWQTAQAIPYGATWTYRQLAVTLQKPDASRAVGTALGANPLLLLVPCHRVVGQNNQLCGFMRGKPGGLVIKEALLSLEAGQQL